MYKIFQFLKQTVNATWHADSDLVIIMEMKKTNKQTNKQMIQLCMYFLKQLVFQGAHKFTFTWVGVRYNKLSIATSMNLCIQYVFIWFVVDA